MEDKQRNCHTCGHQCESFCPVCVLAFETRRPVAEMTNEDRAVELRAWGGPLEIPFPSVLKRIEELMGRSVWTHEMANFDSLVAELTSGKIAHLADVIAKVPPEKLITMGLEGHGEPS